MREKNRQLHGIIKPIDDVFWKQYYPPLDWRCRCDVVATAAEPKGEVPKDMPTPNFVGNVALDQEIFTQKGNFFKLLNSDENAKRNMELMKLNAPYELAYKSKDGKKVMVNIFADKSEPEYLRNLEVAIQIVVKLKNNVHIRPHINNREAKKTPNPEYLINGIIADRKAVKGLNFRNALSKANNTQKTEIVVIDLIDNPYSFDEVLKALESNFQFDSNYPLIKQIVKDRKEVKHYYRKELKKKKGE